MENECLRNAHAKYGPIVRIAPNALSIDGAANLRTVYLGGFKKDPWYSVFDNYGYVFAIPALISH